jgi:hypothetical protein
MSDLLDQQATIAADAADDMWPTGWMTVLRASATDLTSRAQQLPLILNYRLRRQPAGLALAQRIYQDGGRAPSWWRATPPRIRCSCRLSSKHWPPDMAWTMISP